MGNADLRFVFRSTVINAVVAAAMGAATTAFSLHGHEWIAHADFCWEVFKQTFFTTVGTVIFARVFINKRLEGAVAPLRSKRGASSALIYLSAGIFASILIGVLPMLAFVRGRAADGFSSMEAISVRAVYGFYLGAVVGWPLIQMMLRSTAAQRFGDGG